MFNFKKFANDLNFAEKVDIKSIPGTLEQKVEWVKNWFLRNGVELSVQDAYAMLGHVPLGPESQHLEKYRANINQLRDLAGDALKQIVLSQRPDLRQRVMNGEKDAKKELDRLIYVTVSSKLGAIVEHTIQLANQKFIPELVKLHSSSTRTLLDVDALRKYDSPEEIATIQNFISEEIMRLKNEINTKFLRIWESFNKINPDLTLDHMFFILQNTANQILKNEEIPLSPEDKENIKAQVVDLAKSVQNMNNSGAVWARILSLHPDAPNVEEWKQFIPDELKATWNIIAVLQIFHRQLEYEAVPVRVVSNETGKTELLDTSYLYFYPGLKPDGTKFESDAEKKQFALDRLRDCVENGYENERIFSALSITIKKAPKIDQTVVENAPEDEEPSEDLEISEDTKAAEPKDKDASLIRYYYRFICTKSTNTASLMQANSQLGSFRNDLRAAGLGHVADLLSKAYEKQPDLRYSDLDLMFLSGEEGNMINELRENYNLDAIPFPVKIPCPVDNPTSVSRFEIDFLLPCDILVRFRKRYQEFMDENTGERTKIFQTFPVVESQVMFVGEYFGYRRTKPYFPKYTGRPWVKPNGDLPVYSYKKSGKTYDVRPGGFCRYLEFYKLKREWKVFTTEIIADIMGTRTLSLDDRHLEKPTLLMSALDEQGIVYQSPRCTLEVGCKATKLIEETVGRTPEVEKFIDERYLRENFDSPKNRCLRLVDCCIANLKLTTALARTRDEFIPVDDPNNFLGKGFNRQTMYDHLQEKRRILEEISMLEKMHLDDLEDSEILQDLQSARANLKGFYSSPIYDFKMKFEEICENPNGEIYKKLQKFQSLRKEIESETQKYTLYELRVKIAEIDNTFLAERIKDDEVI
jgi:hypothetical protein